MTPDNCPECSTPWKSDQTIFQHFLSKGKTESEARDIATNYGCTPETPKHFSKDVIGIEIQGQYDGVSYWECQKCKTTFDRFTMKKVTK